MRFTRLFSGKQSVVVAERWHFTWNKGENLFLNTNVLTCCYNHICLSFSFQGQLGSTQNKGLIPCVLLVLKEMLPTYHKWRYNTYGVRERIGKGVSTWQFLSYRLEKEIKNWINTLCVAAGCLILELIHAILNLSPEGEDQGRWGWVCYLHIFL